MQDGNVDAYERKNAQNESYPESYGISDIRYLTKRQNTQQRYQKSNQGIMQL